jgi:hypothetical protein
MPADGIGTADKEGAETSVRRRFWAAYLVILGAEHKAQGERPRDYKIFDRSVWSGIDLVRMAAQWHFSAVMTAPSNVGYRG